MASAGIPEALHFRAIIEIDKLDRKSIDEVSESLKTIGISQENIDHLFHHLDEEQSPDNLKKVIEYSQKLGVDMSATGFALGFDRTIEAMEQFKLFPPIQQRNSVLVSVFSPELSDESALVVANLRENNISAELYPDEGIKLDKQLKYADKKGIKWLVVIEPRERERIL